MNDAKLEPPKVFISYSRHSEDHILRVMELVNRLVNNGIDCRYDQQETSPPKGWPRWAEQEIEAAKFVLMVCTEAYRRSVELKEQPGVDQKVPWESNIIYNLLYRSGTINTKLVPVLLGDGQPKHIPIPLQGIQYYRADVEEDYQELCWHLTDQPRDPKRKPGPPRERPRPLLRAPPPALEYVDLNLELHDNATFLACRIHSQQLDLNKEFQLAPPIDAGGLGELLACLQQGQGLIEPESHMKLAEAGGQLYEALVAGAQDNLLRQAVDSCLQWRASLRINLIAQGDIATALPWELLYDQSRKEYIGASPRSVIIRAPLARQAGTYRLMPEGQPVKLLAAAPSSLAVEPTLVGCFGSLKQNGLVELTAIGLDSWDRLEERLHEVQPHVLHLIAASDDQRLYTDGPGGRDGIAYSNLLDRLKAAAAPRLLVLCVYPCDQPIQRPLPLAGHALFSEAEEWACVITPVPISPLTSLRFARLFYTALAAGHTFTFAVGFARAALRHGNTAELLEWSSFMAQHSCEIVPFPRPSLATPPRWASAPPPNMRAMFELLRKADLADEKLREIQDTLDDPNVEPRDLRALTAGPDSLDDIYNELENLEYSGEQMTFWMNDALTIAGKAKQSLRTCWDRLSNLRTHQGSPRDYCTKLKQAHELIDRACDYSRDLIQHIEQLLFHVWTEERAVGQDGGQYADRPRA